MLFVTLHLKNNWVFHKNNWVNTPKKHYYLFHWLIFTMVAVPQHILHVQSWAYMPMYFIFEDVGWCYIKAWSYIDIPVDRNIWFFWDFFKRSTFVGSAWSFGFFIPATTANDLRLRRIFHPRLYPLHLFSYLNSWERASIFPFECSELNKGTTSTIFITSLVWRSPWLGIEPRTSRTRSQHYTTRLSKRL